MTDFILRKLDEGAELPEYRWTSMLNPAPKSQSKVKTAAKPAAKKASSKKAGK